MPLLGPPPPPPRVAIADDDRNRFCCRHRLLVQSGLTILVTRLVHFAWSHPRYRGPRGRQGDSCRAVGNRPGLGSANGLRGIYGPPATALSPRPDTSGGHQEGGRRLQPPGQCRLLSREIIMTSTAIAINTAMAAQQMWRGSRETGAEAWQVVSVRAVLPLTTYHSTTHQTYE